VPFTGQQGGSYGDAGPRGLTGTRLPTASSQATRSRAGYQAQAAQPGRDAVPGGAAGLTLARGTARTNAAPGYAAGTAAGQAGYQSAANAYGYDQAGYSGKRSTPAATVTASAAARGAFPAGYAATSAPGRRGVPRGAKRQRLRGQTGTEATGYGGNEYQANGYTANGERRERLPGGVSKAAGHRRRPSAYPHPSANGYAAGYANGSAPGNGNRGDGKRASDVHPKFRRERQAPSRPAEAGGSGRPGQPARHRVQPRCRDTTPSPFGRGTGLPAGTSVRETANGGGISR